MLRYRMHWRIIVIYENRRRLNETKLCIYNCIMYSRHRYRRQYSSEIMEQLILQVMAAGHGHKDRKYNPNNKDEVRKIKAFIMKKVKEGWHLYGMKAGEKLQYQIKPDDIDDPKLDRLP